MDFDFEIDSVDPFQLLDEEDEAAPPQPDDYKPIEYAAADGSDDDEYYAGEDEDDNDDRPFESYQRPTALPHQFFEQMRVNKASEFEDADTLLDAIRDPSGSGEARSYGRHSNGLLTLHGAHLLGQANIAYTQLQFEQCIAYCTNVISINAHAEQPYSLISMAYEGLGKYEEAAEFAYIYAVMIDSIESMWRAANLFRRARLLVRAVECFESCNRRKRGDLDIIWKIACTEADLGACEEMTKNIRVILERSGVDLPVAYEVGRIALRLRSDQCHDVGDYLTAVMNVMPAKVFSEQFYTLIRLRLRVNRLHEAHMLIHDYLQLMPPHQEPELIVQGLYLAVYLAAGHDMTEKLDVFLTRLEEKVTKFQKLKVDEKQACEAFDAKKHAMMKDLHAIQQQMMSGFSPEQEKLLLDHQMQANRVRLLELEYEDSKKPANKDCAEEYVEIYEDMVDICRKRVEANRKYTDRIQKTLREQMTKAPAAVQAELRARDQELEVSLAQTIATIEQHRQEWQAKVNAKRAELDAWTEDPKVADPLLDTINLIKDITTPAAPPKRRRCALVLLPTLNVLPKPRLVPMTTTDMGILADLAVVLAAAAAPAAKLCTVEVARRLIDRCFSVAALIGQYCSEQNGVEIENAHVEVCRALVHEQFQEYVRAIEILQAVVTKFVEHVEAFSVLRRLYIRTGQNSLVASLGDSTQKSFFNSGARKVFNTLTKNLVKKDVPTNFSPVLPGPWLLQLTAETVIPNPDAKFHTPVIETSASVGSDPTSSFEMDDSSLKRGPPMKPAVCLQTREMALISDPNEYMNRFEDAENSETELAKFHETACDHFNHGNFEGFLENEWPVLMACNQKKGDTGRSAMLRKVLSKLDGKSIDGRHGYCVMVSRLHVALGRIGHWADAFSLVEVPLRIKHRWAGTSQVRTHLYKTGAAAAFVAKQYDVAFRYLSKYFEDSTDRREVWHLLAVIQRITGTSADMRDICRKIAGTHPDSLAVLVSVSSRHTPIPVKIKTLQALVRQAAEEKAETPFLKLFLGAVMLDQLAEKYPSHLPNANEVIVQALATFRMYASERGDTAECYYNIGRAYHQLGLVDIALQYYRHVLALALPTADELRDAKATKVGPRLSPSGFKREAAYNVSRILMQSGAVDAARHILKTHCSF